MAADDGNVGKNDNSDDPGWYGGISSVIQSFNWYSGGGDGDGDGVSLFAALKASAIISLAVIQIKKKK